MEKKKRRNSTTSDDLSVVKAATWAWYQHGSGSEEKPMREFDATRTLLQPPKPSRYKIEAMKIVQQPSLQEYNHSSSSSTTRKDQNHSLLDAYEIERISNQLDCLILSNSNRFNGFDNKDLDCRKSSSSEVLKNKNNKKKNFLKGIWLRHSIVCGTKEDVNSRALVRTRPGGRVRSDD